MPWDNFWKYNKENAEWIGRGYLHGWQKVQQSKLRWWYADNCYKHPKNYEDCSQDKRTEHKITISICNIWSLLLNNRRKKDKARQRINIALPATTKLIKIWKHTAITRNTKICLVQVLIFHIANSSSQIWMLKNSDPALKLLKCPEIVENGMPKSVLKEWNRTIGKLMIECKVKERGRSESCWADQVKILLQTELHDTIQLVQGKPS